MGELVWRSLITGELNDSLRRQFHLSGNGKLYIIPNRTIQDRAKPLEASCSRVWGQLKLKQSSKQRDHIGECWTDR